MIYDLQGNKIWIAVQVEQSKWEQRIQATVAS
jgi:hypothetical protein